MVDDPRVGGDNDFFIKSQQTYSRSNLCNRVQGYDLSDFNEIATRRRSIDLKEGVELE